MFPANLADDTSKILLYKSVIFSPPCSLLSVFSEPPSSETG